VLNVLSTNAILAKRALVAIAKELLPGLFKSLSFFCSVTFYLDSACYSYFFTRFFGSISSIKSDSGIKPKGI